MSALSFTQILLNATEEELHQIFDKVFADDCTELPHMLAYHLGWEGPGAGKDAQGKRIRPLLLLLTVNALGNSWQTALPAAAALEFLHNFSLIHDDIQDKSELRRNRPTIWVKWGIAQAINAGDSLFTLAQLAILHLQENFSAQISLAATQLMNRACAQLTQGQYLDLSYENRLDLVIDDYWPMIAGKTAALLSASTELGAVLGQVPSSVQSALREFGWNLGLAFQVQDDFLGIWGDPAKIGKSNTSDLVSGKRTLPILYGLGQKRQFADLWTNKAITEETLPEAIALLSAEGAQTYTQQTVNRLFDAAMKSLENFLPEGEAACTLLDFTHNLLGRQV